MATDKTFIEFIFDQLNDSDNISYKKMFGEYGIYYKGKIVALACDNQLFIKPTEKGKNYIGNPEESPPYPGAKPCFLITDKIEEPEWLYELILITYKELPEPVKKKKKVKS